MEQVRPARGVEAVITHALHALTRIPAVGRAGIALDEGAGRRLLFTASDRSGPAIDWCHIDAYDDVPLTHVARSGRPVSGTLAELADQFPEFVARQAGTATTALIATPLEHDGALLGGVVVFLHDTVPFAAVHDAVRWTAATTAARLDALRRRAASPSAPYDPDDQALPALSFTIAEAKDVPAARRRLRQLLTERAVDTGTIDDAAMCLSELLANAVMHASATADVRVETTDTLLRVTVRDRGSYLGIGPQPVRDVASTAVHGRGLQILAALSTRWGSDQSATGAAVWFELDLGDQPATPGQGRPRAPEQRQGLRSVPDRVSIPDQDRR